MKIVCVNIVMVILFSATLVSFSYAGASCCPGAGCCGTTNISGDQRQLRAPSTGSNQTKLGTLKKTAPQVNPMPWSATVNQIGTERLAPASTSPGCCPGTNSTGGCCESTSKSTLSPGQNTSMVDEVLAFKPFLGTLW